MTASLRSTPSTAAPVEEAVARWNRRIVLSSGTAVLVRPLASDDDALLRRFLENVSRTDRRLRFFSTVKDFSDAFIHRLTGFDRSGAMAFMALDESTGNPFGVVRIDHEGSVQGEFAVVLRSDSHGLGLGWKLIELVIEYARSIGLQRVVGQVLQENRAMIEMCRELGFSVANSRVDRGTCDVSLDLAA